MNEGVWQELSAHREPLIRYLVRVTGDEELAADAAQEAYARLADRPPAHARNLRGWLYAVAMNHALDAIKVARRRAVILDEHRGDLPWSRPTKTPEDHLEDGERRDTVRRALGQLRDKERRILVLRAEGYSYREISVRTGIPMNSIGVIGARALRKLAAVLEPFEVSS